MVLAGTSQTAPFVINYLPAHVGMHSRVDGAEPFTHAHAFDRITFLTAVTIVKYRRRV